MKRPGLISTLIVASIAMLLGFQWFANTHDTRGPILNLVDAYLGAPPSFSVPWGALVVALVGVDVRTRWVAVGAALSVDVLTCALQFVRDEPIDPGKGPLLLLPVLALAIVARYRAEQRTLALRGVGLAALLVMAWQLAASCLHASIVLKPYVYDEYVLLADRAFGYPSWLVAKIVNANFAVHWLVGEVYSDLTFAAVFVVFWQLRNVVRDRAWPEHYLLRTFLVMGIVGPLCYFAFPVVGPLFAYGVDGTGSQVADWWPTVSPHPDFSPEPIPFNNLIARNCMPSMHTAWALSIFIHTRREPRWLRLFGTCWLVVTCLATLGLGYHYVVDLIAGVVLCLTVEAALRDPGRGWGWFRVRIVGAGALLFGALLGAYRYLAPVIGGHPEFSVPLLLGASIALSVGFYATFFARTETRVGAR